jgi:hypothetical protein
MHSDFPEIHDSGGYILQPHDITFVGVKLGDLRAMLARDYPLGFPNPEEWRLCREELRAALLSDGLIDADVRLKGSSTEFFSRSSSKAFPKSGAECRALAATKGLDGAVAESLWNASPYSSAITVPNQCFWDCSNASASTLR